MKVQTTSSIFQYKCRYSFSRRFSVFPRFFVKNITITAAVFWCVVELPLQGLYAPSCSSLTSPHAQQNMPKLTRMERGCQSRRTFEIYNKHPLNPSLTDPPPLLVPTCFQGVCFQSSTFWYAFARENIKARILICSLLCHRLSIETHDSADIPSLFAPNKSGQDLLGIRAPTCCCSPQT